MLVSSDDNLCKQKQNVGHDLDPSCLALWIGIPEIIFEKVDFEKKSGDDKKECKITQ